MQDEVNTEREERYPWARTLMIVVLYGAVLVFLWHFPTSGGRVFFQTLFKGFLYLLAGLALIALTLLAFTFIPLPPAWRFEDEDMEDEPESEEADWDMWASSVFLGRALMVPDLRSPKVEPEVWDILHAIEDEFDLLGVIVADPSTGIVTVTEETPEEADFLLHEIRQRLRQEKISVRIPR